MAAPHADDDRRPVWVVTWGRPGRVDWKVVRVRAHDAEEALQSAREEHPHLLPPTAAILARG